VSACPIDEPHRGCTVGVLLLPLAAPRFGVAVVVAGIAVACSLLIAFHHRTHGLRFREAG